MQDYNIDKIGKALLWLCFPIALFLISADWNHGTKKQNIFRAVCCVALLIPQILFAIYTIANNVVDNSGVWNYIISALGILITYFLGEKKGKTDFYHKEVLFSLVQLIFMLLAFKEQILEFFSC